jgi:SAM-dependent methyltransferase
MNLQVSYMLHLMFRAVSGIKYARLQRLVDKVTGAEGEHWSRVVMRANYRHIIEELPLQELRALEISGNYFNKVGFKEYKSIHYPEFDLCAGSLPEEFDLIIAEQVFEHLLWPYRAGKNVYQMLRPSGYFLISTPFLVRIHNYPTDCTRWTEMGLKYFLAECGFALERIRTFSWGNQACIKANFTEWVGYRRRIHSLINEPDFPYHIWALAQK